MCRECEARFGNTVGETREAPSVPARDEAVETQDKSKESSLEPTAPIAEDAKVFVSEGGGLQIGKMVFPMDRDEASLIVEAFHRLTASTPAAPELSTGLQKDLGEPGAAIGPRDVQGQMELNENARELLRYINATPALLSLLYDIDMMPEQLTRGTSPWVNMLIIAAAFRDANGEAYGRGVSAGAWTTDEDNWRLWIETPNLQYVFDKTILDDADIANLRLLTAEHNASLREKEPKTLEEP